MGIIFYGFATIGFDVEEFLLRCPCCEKNSWADVMVISKYFHVYHFPIMPVDKEASVICKECGLKRMSSFDKYLISNYDEVKRRFRHPWFVYSGIGIVVFIFLVFIYALFIKV